MSEELRQRGYMGGDGGVSGKPAEKFEAFNLGATSLGQLARAGVIPERDYGRRAKLKPDALVVSRNGAGPSVRLVAEFKAEGALANDAALEAVVRKVATEYCAPLACPLAVVSDGRTVRWVAVDAETTATRIIMREDGYPLEAPIKLDTKEELTDTARTIARIRRELNPAGHLKPPETVDPTRLADQTWQAIWLASGENPERCLASFIEVLLFKFLSDLGTLSKDRDGCPTTFEHVAGLRPTEALGYYFKVVRPEITRLFPVGRDKTGVIGGLVLRPDNVDHGRLFAEILRNFREAEPLKRIDPEFKSRIFERFLKKSISRKNWGQYFTPRNVVKAIVEMSGIEHLAPEELVVDPFCGVGGFLLEPLVHKRPHDFRSPGGQPLRYQGYDRDPKTIALAKANMLIHLSEVLENDPERAPVRLASLLNETFQAMDQSITGSLALVRREEWDLVMTNPPYVVTGTGTQRKMLAKDAGLAAHYSVPGAGVENLCLQQVIAGLKRGRRALVIVPDGLLLRHSEEALKRHLLRHCLLEAVISLPKDAFYSTPKKTYILVFRKKPHADERQKHGVLTYLVGEVGETRDAKRFPIAANDLPRMVSAFKRFQADPAAYSGEDPAERIADPRARVEPIGSFLPEEHWLVDRWRPEAERRALGDVDESEAISPEALATRLREISATLRELADLISESSEVHGPLSFATVSLDDPDRFRLSIGKRVLKQELFGRAEGPIPLYSANVTQPFGHVHSSNIEDFGHQSVLWGIDGDFHLAAKEAGVEFATTDHCGRIEILDDRLDAGYCRAALALARTHGFDRTLRPSLRRVEALEIKVPVGPDGELDPVRQRALAREYDALVDSLAEAASELRSLASLQPEVMFQAEGEAALPG
ncbi:MAG TPA: N-6 DNA methylase [Solirubrobacterales bacterium]|nr:N-6 DNA methylase [Solirubrobacterales bacterium]